MTLDSDARFASGSKLTLVDGKLVYTPGLVTATLAGKDTITYTVTDTVTGAATKEAQVVTVTLASSANAASAIPAVLNCV